MNILYLECNMGAAGDMLMAALLELIGEKQAFIDKMNGLGLRGVCLAAETSVKCGISGTHVTVKVNGTEEASIDVDTNELAGQLTDHGHHGHHDHDEQHTHLHEHIAHTQTHSDSHHHSGISQIKTVISQLDLPAKVRDEAIAVYELIATAESHVHGKPVDQIHFHEVGTMDAIADIVGVCLLMDALSPDRILASPVHVGSGQVRCAHGILPVPAPATAYILQGVPTYGGTVRGELCTPTGAALLKHFVDDFGAMPVMRVSAIGYGMGKKDFDAANCVRAMLGESDFGKEHIVELCCNLDDMTPEAIGFAQERLLEGGALDVYTAAIGMKKSRPGILFSCICRSKDRDRIIGLIFKHTTTLGIRENVCKRYTLKRSERSVQTRYGMVRIKDSAGWGTTRSKAEYEDLAEIARKSNLSFVDLSREILDNERLQKCLNKRVNF